MKDENYPQLDFLVVASARGGTSWLYKCLFDHPQICLTQKKEYVPFDQNGVLSVDGLKSQFADCHKPGALLGGMPLAFSIQKNSSRFVKKYWPQAKIIMILRNPIERAYSHYKNDIFRGQSAENISFGEAIRSDAYFLKYGFYADVVSTYREDMGDKNVLILLHDDVMKDHAGTVATVQKFLGIRQLSSEYVDSFVSVSRRTGKVYRSESLLNMHRTLIVLSAKVKKVGGEGVGKIFKFLGFGKILSSMYSYNFREHIAMGKEKDKEDVLIDSKDRDFLKSYYAEDIKGLSVLLRRDINWN